MITSSCTKQKVEKEKEKKKKTKKYYKEVLDFHNIEYHITFLIVQISGQQCHSCDSPRNSSSLNLNTKKVIDC